MLFFFYVSIGILPAHVWPPYEFPAPLETRKEYPLELELQA